MGGPEQPPRVALFALACGVLVASALLFSKGGSDPAEAPARGPVIAPPLSVSGEPSLAGLGVSARHFLKAFLRYEVGDIDTWVSRGLTATAAPGFASTLLENPPRTGAAPGTGGSVELGELHFAIASIQPPRALVTGTAFRGGLPEELSFLFEERGHSWYAVGPGE
jgi:hypothetical protein